MEDIDHDELVVRMHVARFIIASQIGNATSVFAYTPMTIRTLHILRACRNPKEAVTVNHDGDVKAFSRRLRHVPDHLDPQILVVTSETLHQAKICKVSIRTMR